MATISELDAARIIMDLIKDRTVTNAAPYAQVDKIGAAIGNKYGEPIWNCCAHLRPRDGADQEIAWADMTGEQKGTMIVDHLYEHFRDMRAGVQKRTSADSAGRTAFRDAVTEAEVDLR